MQSKSIQHGLRSPGYCFVDAQTTCALLKECSKQQITDADFTAFQSSWFDMPLDTYMADQGRYRRRRHACFEVNANASSPHDVELRQLAHRPHLQGLEYNRLNGGIERWFAPILPETISGDVLLGIVRMFCAQIQPLQNESTRWFCELHQFRIEANAGAAGLPTPEGVHRDGVDYVLVMLINRVNIAAGTTTMHDQARQEIGSFTLTQPLEMVLLDDHLVYHGVTAVHAIDDTLPAYRDVLVVTLKRTTQD